MSANFPNNVGDLPHQVRDLVREAFRLAGVGQRLEHSHDAALMLGVVCETLRTQQAEIEEMRAKVQRGLAALK